jgi:hypothetical protein
MDSYGSEYSLVAGFCKDANKTLNARKVRKFLMSWTTSDTGLFG